MQFKLPLVLSLLALGGLAAAQTPTYLHIPAPKGRQSLALWAIDQAKSNGYDGVVLPVGTDRIQNPDAGYSVTWADFDACAKECARLRLRIFLRLLQNVPAYAYSNGVRIGPSAWATKYNGGKTWDTPNRPPAALWSLIPKKIWSPALGYVWNAYKAKGLDATAYIACELTNEPGIGGQGGPYVGSSKPSYPGSGWPSAPEGTIEPEFARMLRVMRYAFPARGCRTFAVTFEGQHGDASANEVASVDPANTDWQQIAAGCSGFGFNRYMTVPASSPDAAANIWRTREQAEVELLRSNPLIAGKSLFLTEFGMSADPRLRNGDGSLADYRTEIVRTQRQLSNIVGAGLYTSVSTNSKTSGFELWDALKQPIGGIVRP